MDLIGTIESGESAGEEEEFEIGGEKAFDFSDVESDGSEVDAQAWHSKGRSRDWEFQKQGDLGAEIDVGATTLEEKVAMKKVEMEERAKKRAKRLQKKADKEEMLRQRAIEDAAEKKERAERKALGVREPKESKKPKKKAKKKAKASDSDSDDSLDIEGCFEECDDGLDLPVDADSDGEVADAAADIDIEGSDDEGEEEADEALSASCALNDDGLEEVEDDDAEVSGDLPAQNAGSEDGLNPAAGIVEVTEPSAEAGADFGPAPAPSRSYSLGDHLKTQKRFADLHLSRPLLKALVDLEFDQPTPVQAETIPVAMQGKDVLATAETGSGKTAAFLLPILERLCQSGQVRQRRRDKNGDIICSGKVGTKALILVPTRELAVQCYSMLRKLATHTMVTHVMTIGGFDSQYQQQSLRQQPDIVVATPGRILDHLMNAQSVHMELLEIVVFDEADRLLELGFRAECIAVLKHCARNRQTMLFSATVTNAVNDLAALALRAPVRVAIGKANLVVRTLQQEFVKLAGDEVREATLMQLVTTTYKKNVLIFVNTKKEAHRIAILFAFAGLKFGEFHGHLSQTQRVDSITKFQTGEVPFLIATDVAARGLDIPTVDVVINFEIPVDDARYVHRVGRTARMGQRGCAVTLYTAEEYKKVKALAKRCQAEKMQTKMMDRKVAANLVQEWKAKIAELEPDILSILQEEGLEREERLALLQAQRADNTVKHQDKIQARPAKIWHQTTREKRALKEEDRETVGDGCLVTEGKKDVLEVSEQNMKKKAKMNKMERNALAKQKEARPLTEEEIADKKAARIQDAAVRAAKRKEKPHKLGAGRVGQDDSVGFFSAGLREEREGKKKRKRPMRFRAGKDEYKQKRLLKGQREGDQDKKKKKPFAKKGHTAFKSKGKHNRTKKRNKKRK